MFTAVFRYRHVAGVVLLSAALGACQLATGITNALPNAATPEQPQTAAPTDNENSDPATERPRFEQFNDVPVPQDAQLDLERSLILGSRDGWTGRMVYSAPFSMTEMFVFFEQEMLRFGWQPLTAVRASISTLSFQRGARIATIMLQQRLTGGASISMTMTPVSGVSGDSQAQ